MIYEGNEILPHKYEGLIFGDKNQLKVLGYFGVSKSYHKYLICECSICKLDTELFGSGLFKTKYSNITQGAIPCGCAKQVIYTEKQQRVRIERACQNTGIKFLGFIGQAINGKTKLSLECASHGVWQSTDIDSLIYQGVGCIACGNIRSGLKRKLEDQLIIDSILASSAFHPDTKFTRSDRKTLQGASNFWYVHCPECNTIGEGWIGNLQNGSRPCECVKGRQTEAYINLIKDDKNIIGVKFGISRNSLQRLYWINHNTIYSVENYAVYSFPDTASTRRAEIECKRSMLCGVISKEEMPDGYSETTFTSNIDKIIQIYIENGGIRLD